MKTKTAKATTKKATTKKIGQVRKSNKVAKVITKNLKPLNQDANDFVKMLEANVLSSKAIVDRVKISLTTDKSFLVNVANELYSREGSKNTKLDTMRKTIKRVSSKLAKDGDIETPLTLKLVDKEKGLFVLKVHTPKEQETPSERLMKMFEKHHAELNEGDWSVIMGYHAEAFSLER